MKSKKIIVGILCVLFLFVLTGCGKKNAITADDFKSLAKKNNYTVYDISNQYTRYPHIKSAIVARSSLNYQVEFYVLINDEYASSMFDSNKSIFENSKGNSSTYSSTSVGNYSTYSLTSNGYYMYLSRIDNTLLYLKVNDIYKKNVKNLVDDLGY